MITIYKYPLKVEKKQIVEFPYTGQILCVQVQRGVPCLWVLHDTNDTNIKHHICIYGTGHKISDSTWPKRYIGTFQVDNETFVFHVFEEEINAN